MSWNLDDSTRLRMAARFWAKTVRGSSGECWPFKSCGADQRGRLRVGDRSILATHISWFLFRGAWPPDALEVCHSCDNPRCVNPGHLWLGTQKENMADCVSKGRTAVGERHGSAKLTADKVAQIRARRKAGESYPRIARDFGVSARTARRVATGENWGHLESGLITVETLRCVQKSVHAFGQPSGEASAARKELGA